MIPGFTDCYSWKSGEKRCKGCNLDDDNMSFTTNADCGASLGTNQVWVRLAMGRPKEIRVLSANCPVSSNSEIVDHGLIPMKQNMAWFRSVIEDRSMDQDIREEALFALIMSETDEAYQYIDKLLSKH